jgi:hypothetical protein
VQGEERRRAVETELLRAKVNFNFNLKLNSKVLNFNININFDYGEPKLSAIEHCRF